jgi:phosphopantothenoylcysteine decarboxylase
MDDRPTILFGITGSVAAVKFTKIATLLNEFANVIIISTSNAKHFMELSKSYDVESQTRYKSQLKDFESFTDSDEWTSYSSVHEDKVLHIELRKKADLFLIAPLSANSLAKISSGICDNLLTCVARAWNFRSGKPFLVAPAMNTAMWDHPATSSSINTIKGWGVQVIEPQVKELACGDVGNGALAEVGVIVSKVKEALALRRS